jgi:hypothetical protein
MISKLISLAAGAAVLALNGTAYAKEPLAPSHKQPVALSDSQMDRVTAGGTALANAAGIAFGEVTAVTLSQTSTDVVQGVSGSANPSRVVLAQAWNLSTAAGGFLFNTQAISHSDTYAAWAP